MAHPERRPHHSAIDPDYARRRAATTQPFQRPDLGPREGGSRGHPSDPSGRNACATASLHLGFDAGENIKALSEYLGHHDPGFTLRTYTHLMPNSTARTQRAIDGLFGATDEPINATAA
ncbi:MAG: hypothetical protein LC808_36490 [Actinobacteria bacterium]|nr:hypothetical protein [Actinomycetota bacterium]